MADANQQLIQQKLASLGLDVPPEEFVASLPPPVRRRVEALQQLQDRKNELEKEFLRERAELEAKYEKLYTPLYVERKDIVRGTKEVPPAEGEPAGDESIKGIPEFWQAVLLKCDITAEMIKDKDLDVLHYLSDISSETMLQDGESRGFKLRFTFEANPYFSNEVLEKTYIMGDDQSVLEKSIGTKILWSAGKDVTVKVMKKKPKKGAKPDAKPQMKTEKVESFFNFFDPPQVPEEGDEMEDEAMEELQTLIETDYEVGATIREKLVGDAVAWYTGEAMEDEGGYPFGEDDDEDDDDEDGEFDDGDDDDDDEDDEDDAPAPPKGKAGRGKGSGAAAAAGAAGEQPPECKQQ